MELLNTNWLKFWFVLWAIAPALSATQPQTPTEYEVKAAFLLNFARFIEWPPEYETGPICIGIVGQDPFGPVLDEAIKGQGVNGRAFVVRRFRKHQEAAACHIVFFGASEESRLPSLLTRLQPGAVLTVGETPEFCRKGGIINFELAGNRVRFEINFGAAHAARLHISSKLLSLATRVLNTAE